MEILVRFKNRFIRSVNVASNADNEFKLILPQADMVDPLLSKTYRHVGEFVNGVKVYEEQDDG